MASRPNSSRPLSSSIALKANSLLANCTLPRNPKPKGRSRQIVAGRGGSTHDQRGRLGMQMECSWNALANGSLKHVVFSAGAWTFGFAILAIGEDCSIGDLQLTTQKRATDLIHQIHEATCGADMCWRCLPSLADLLSEGFEAIRVQIPAQPCEIGHLNSFDSYNAIQANWSSSSAHVSFFSVAVFKRSMPSASPLKFTPRGQTPLFVAINRGALQKAYKMNGCK